MYYRDSTPPACGDRQRDFLRAVQRSARASQGLYFGGASLSHPVAGDAPSRMVLMNSAPLSVFYIYFILYFRVRLHFCQ